MLRWSPKRERERERERERRDTGNRKGDRSQLIGWNGGGGCQGEKMTDRFLVLSLVQKAPGVRSLLPGADSDRSP